MMFPSPLRRRLLASAFAFALTATACANETQADAQATSTETATATVETVSDTHVHDNGNTHANHDHNDSTPALSDGTEDPLLKDIKFVTTAAPTDHILGDATAPVTVISYASVTCPHCGDWFTNEWPTFKSELIDTGKVRFVFREFPTQPVQLAMAGFLIANCVDESRYFEAIEYQMKNQEMIFEAAQAGNARQTYVDIALKFGLADETAMETCLTDQSKIDKIALASARAQAGKVAGVPAFFIDEVLYKGNTSYATLKDAIDAEMKVGITKMEK